MMADAANSDAFIIHRLRAKPVEYTIKIRHFVSGGEWMLGVAIHDISEPDQIQRDRVASDLRRCADLVEQGEWSTT